MRPICVFGIMDNDKGRMIADEMRKWLRDVYDVREVLHDGSLFEYPALKLAHDLSIEYDEPVLYIHTRGAVNTYPYTIPTRRCWADQFGKQWKKYFTIAKTDVPRVVCPFVDYDRETRYNGFVANTAAWRLIDLKPSKDRFDFERLWIDKPDCEVLGLLVHSDEWAIKEIRKYLLTNYA